MALQANAAQHPKREVCRARSERLCSFSVPFKTASLSSVKGTSLGVGNIAVNRSMASAFV